MGVTKCCVLGCGSTSDSGILLHSIPRTPYRKSLWLKQINCEYLNSLNDIQLRSKRVCAKHFERKFYENDRLNCLIARPTLFKATEIASGIPIYGQSDELYNELKIPDSLKDHTYYNVFFNSVDQPQTLFTDSVFNTACALQQIEEYYMSEKSVDESCEDNNLSMDDDTTDSIEVVESNPLEINETINDTSMVPDKTFIQTPFSLEINENEFSKQLENQKEDVLRSKSNKLPLIKVKVFETQQVNLLNKGQTPDPSVLNKSKKPALITVKKLIPVNLNLQNANQKSYPSIVNKPVLPKIQECRVNVKKLPKLITDTINNEKPASSQSHVTTVEAPNKIYKVVNVNNKILLVEQNENELDLESVADDSSLDEDYDPNKDPNISDADSDICDTSTLQKPEEINKKQVIEDKQKTPIKQYTQKKRKEIIETCTENKAFDKSQFISKKPFPTFYKSNNPFMCTKSRTPSVLHNTKAYKNLYPGVYVAKNQINNNQDSLEANELGEKENSPKFTRVVEDFVNQFSDIMNYEWYNDQDILIYGKKGTAMVLLHEAKYKTMKKIVDETKLIEEAFENHVKQQSILQEKYYTVEQEWIKVQKELDKACQELKKVKNELNVLNETKYLPLKSNFNEILKELIILRALRDNLSKSFSPAQISLLAKKKDKVSWSEDDIKKIMFLKSNISPSAYKFLKGQMKFPLPTFETVQQWMAERNLLTKTKSKNKKAKDSLGDCKLNVLTEDTTISVQANESSQQDETQQAIEMIIEEPQEEVAHNEQQQICLSYVEDCNNVNEEYFIIDENYINSDGSFVAGEMYVQDGGDVHDNNVNDDTQVVEHDAHYADTENYVEHFNAGDEENVDYIDAQNQTEQEESSITEYITEDIVDHDITNNDDSQKNNEEQTHEEHGITRGKYAKWDLNTLQNFRQKRINLHHRYNWNQTCQLCMRQFESADDLSLHVPVHYNNIYVTPYINAQRPYKCEFCQEQLPHRFAVVRHHVEHLNITEFRCWQPGCTYVGKNKPSLLAHAEIHMPRQHACPSCAARFKDRPALRDHYARKHSQRGKYTCTLCGGFYYSEFTYYLHMRSHEKPPRFKCNVDGCTESFYCQRARTSHRQTHTGRTVYQCPHCPIATFYTRNMYNKHMLRHDSEKLTKCARCYKIFNTYTEYYYHIKTDPHTRTFNTHTCFCKQTFRFKKELKKHQKQCELAAKPWRNLNLGKLERAMMLASENKLENVKEQKNNEPKVIITSQKIWSNDQIQLLTETKNSENTQENVVQQKPLKLFPVSEEQQKMLEKMTRLKKLIPVPHGEKIERFKFAQKVYSGKVKNLHKTNNENNSVSMPLQQINPSPDKENNELIPQEKVTVEDSYERIIMNGNNQQSVTASEITLMEATPVTHEVTSDNVMVAEQTRKPKVITLSNKLRKLSVYEFHKLMAKSANAKVTNNVRVENIIHQTMMNTDDDVLSTAVVQTPEYSQHVESRQDGQQYNVDVPDVIGTQPDMPTID